MSILTITIVRHIRISLFSTVSPHPLRQCENAGVVFIHGGCFRVTEIGEDVTEGDGMRVRGEDVTEGDGMRVRGKETWSVEDIALRRCSRRYA